MCGMNQFTSDLSKEAQVTEYLKRHLFDRLFESWSVVDDTERQKQGIDVRGVYDSEECCVDIKAQMDYVNDPLSTFVLELFSETNYAENIGWFLNDELETDYYLFVRLNAVDTFQYQSIIDAIQYDPVQELDTVPSFIKNNGRYCFRMEDIDKFSKEFFPISEEMFTGLSEDEKTFNVHCIRNVDVVLLDKEQIISELANRGFMRDQLLDDARQAYRTGCNVHYDCNGIKKIHVSNRHGECPVNLVVEYEGFYDKVCDEKIELCI